MITINIPTSDGVIWGQEQIFADIIYAMSLNSNISLNFNIEGPDIQSLGLYNFLISSAKKLNYDIKKIIIYVSNVLEKHTQFNIQHTNMLHLRADANEYMFNVKKNTELKYFGLFVGRSNAPRLALASYLNLQHPEKSIYTYHLNIHDEFHQANIGLENLIKEYGTDTLDNVCTFLKSCPRLLDNTNSITINKTLNINSAQQLLTADKNIFIDQYNNFFVEIVCESYFTGRTFFVTEKTWRPILLKTPFIIQGPQYFLHNLRKLGFQTFDQWWDEGYAEDPASHQIIEIKKVIDFLAIKSSKEIADMYKSMQEILEHNYQLLLSLTENDLKKISERTE